MSLVVCPECSRHIRRNETACPFCGAAVAASVAGAPERALPTTRLGRTALFAFAAASVSAAACGSSTDDSGSNKQQVADGSAGGAVNGAGGYDMGGAQALYGAVAPTGGDTGAGGTFNTGSGGMAGAAYGTPPPTGGTTGSGGEIGLPLYGAPFIPPDAGADGGPDAATATGGTNGAGGSFQALYGLPPPAKP